MVKEPAGKMQKSISKETEELYTRYSLPIVIPSETAKPDGEVEEAKTAIIKQSGLTFELSNDRGGFSSTNKLVKVEKKGKKSTIRVDLPDNEKAELNFLLVSCKGSLPVDIVINTGKGSLLSLFEWYGSVGPGSATVSAHHINARAGSCVEVSALHCEDGQAVVSASLSAVAEAGSLVMLNSVYKGGNMTKALSFAEAKGEGSKISINEIALGGDGQKFDLQSAIVNSERAPMRKSSRAPYSAETLCAC